MLELHGGSVVLQHASAQLAAGEQEDDGRSALKPNFEPLPVSIEQIVSAESDTGLDQLLQRAAETCNYHCWLPVSWSYWHYGRHAEYAAELRMFALSALFGAAWQVAHRIIGGSTNDEVAMDSERESIRSSYKSTLACYAEEHDAEASAGAGS